ncbi:Aminotransferase apf4 [Metarhizium anisopliae]|nr:Aminotransferase apf4 [Metarhizium anisopliae]
MSVHGLAPGLNYGQQCYEGLKAFRTNNKAHAIHVFRPQAHAARLRNSAAMVLLPEVPDERFPECVRMVAVANAEFVPPADNDMGFLYLRPVLFGAGPQLRRRGAANKARLRIYQGTGWRLAGKRRDL